MIPAELLRKIRNELPMSAPDPGRVSVKPASGPITIRKLAEDGPYAKISEGFFRFICPHCHQMRATVNPRNNMAHFSPDPESRSSDLLGSDAVRKTLTTLTCFCQWDMILKALLHF